MREGHGNRERGSRGRETDRMNDKIAKVDIITTYLLTMNSGNMNIKF